jgi:hypothetical protein
MVSETKSRIDRVCSAETLEQRQVYSASLIAAQSFVHTRCKRKRSPPEMGVGVGTICRVVLEGSKTREKGF